MNEEITFLEELEQENKRLVKNSEELKKACQETVMLLESLEKSESFSEILEILGRVHKLMKEKTAGLERGGEKDDE